MKIKRFLLGILLLCFLSTLVPAQIVDISKIYVQYVSLQGNDSKEGYSWGTSKLTVGAACAALTGGASDCSTGSGVIYVAPGYNPTIPATYATTIEIHKLGSSESFIQGKYLNFGGALGSSGYGIYDNAGTLQFKNSGGVWSSLAAGAMTYPGVGLPISTGAAWGTSLTPVQSKILIGNATPAWAVSAWTMSDPGAVGAVLYSDGTNWTRSASPTLTSPVLGTATGTSIALTGSSANIFAAGLNGTTNPAFNVDASTGLSATGLNVKSAAAAGGLAVSVLSSGVNENLTIDAKGSGTVTVNGTGTGAITLGRATTVTTGGLTVSAGGATITGNSTITGTLGSLTGLTVASGGETITSGNLLLSAGTITGTSASAAALSVGLNGATNPAFNVDASTGLSATGVNIKSAAAAGGVAVTATSSGVNENMSIAAKGSGTLSLNTAVLSSTGALTTENSLSPIGTGALVRATSATLVTPTLGAASATSINKVALTAPATGATLTIADGKTLTVNNTMTLAAGADSQTWTFPASSGTVTVLGNTVTGSGGTLVEATSPTLVTPTLGAASATSVTASGALSGATYSTATNCSSSASPAVCAAAAAGSVVIAAAATTVQVNTSAVTANSQILVFEDSSLGTKLSVTCNTTLGRTYAVTARVAATSFTLTSSAAPSVNPACLSYVIVN